MSGDRFRFIHAADIHIDSPLRGLEAYEGAPVERLRRATRDAFENLIRLAIEEEVAFVVIAGDLFDGKWPNMETGLWTARQFRQLAQRDFSADGRARYTIIRIRLFLACGVCVFDSNNSNNTPSLLARAGEAPWRMPGTLAG